MKDPKLEIKHELWRKAVLSWKLDKAQKELYDLFYNSTFKVMTWLLARRSGKTYTLCILALEQCIRQPNSIVKFVSPTKIQVNMNVRPLFKQILEDCPEDVRPEFKGKDYIYYFPNGSEIQLAGTDSQHAEKLRGGDSHIWFVDEAGSCDDLENVVKNILIPTTLITKGKGVLASTPPSKSDHDFLKFIEEADIRGSLIKKTIEDNPRITQEQKDDLILELGGINSDSCRRELFCELIKDSNTSVLPEFTPELEKEIVKEWPKPPFYDTYEAMDLGFKDLTVILFGYFDFRADKVIIEDEIVLTGQEIHLPKLVEAIKEKETKLWKNTLTQEVREPYIRVSDINYIVTQEILKYSNYKMNFIPAKKDDNETALNTLRVMLAGRKIIIHPRCTTLIRHLRNVKWMSPNNKIKFGRSPDDGHYDAVDAIKYMVRHIQYNKNPYPAHFGMNMKDLYVSNPEKFNSGNPVDVYRKIFGLKKR